MSKRITIIGAGPGGYVAALRGAELGAQVTVIENDNLGGTCLNWGCIPTKTLKSSAEAARKAARLKSYGVDFNGEIQPDFTAIMARKDKVVSTLVSGIDKAFKTGEISLIKGTGEVVNPNLVRVVDQEGTFHEVAGDKLILATGSRPQALPNLSFDGKTILSSDDVLKLKTIPGKIIILGGGVIGAEFAFIFKQFGSEVTVVEAMGRLIPLPNVDVDMSKTLLREMKKNKITVHVKTTITGIQTTSAGQVIASLGPSPFFDKRSHTPAQDRQLQADAIFLTVGRAPNSKGIGIVQMGVELDDKGWVLANEKMETPVAGVYAIGDILGPKKVMLAHVASMEGLVAVENCLGGQRQMDYGAVPSGIYTFPEVADVGLTESESKAAGIDYTAETFLFRELGMSQAKGELSGQIKMITEKPTGRVLGVHIIGEHATELIAEAVLAIKMGATAQDLAETIHAHPTLAEGLWEVARKSLWHLETDHHP
jgi:dihydrolipoamide dehydrogenase